MMIRLRAFLSLSLSLSLSRARARSLSRSLSLSRSFFRFLSRCLSLGVPLLEDDQVASLSRCRANVAHIRQSRPDSGLGSQVKVLKMS